MSPRQARRERRAAERKTKKAAQRREKLELRATPLTQPAPPQEDLLGFVSQNINNANSTEAADPVSHLGFVSQDELPTALKRLAANRANAQRSTGPRTPSGKAASSRNATRHGLASGLLILPGEDPAEFNALLANLMEDFSPATSTEELLVHDMAQSHWLSLRALHLQERCFTSDGVNASQLALFLRYETTHTRAFYKAFEALRRLQKDRARGERASVQPTKAKPAGFVSQPPSRASFVPPNTPPPAGFVSQYNPELATERPPAGESNAA